MKPAWLAITLIVAVPLVIVAALHVWFDPATERPVVLS